MLTWDEPGDFAMIVHYQIQLKAGTMQCWTETKEWNIENEKKSKIEKNETQKKETKEILKSILKKSWAQCNEKYVE